MGRGNARKIQKTSFVNCWFELNFKKKLFEMLEFIQPSKISTEPIFFIVFGFIKKSARTSHH